LVNTNIGDSNAFHARKAFADANAQFVCGFKTAESNIEDLKNPSHERHFTVPDESEDPQTERNMHVKKIQILYALYLLKTKSSSVDQKTFYSFAEEFLQNLPDNDG
jgi:hypothetical protein